MTSYKFKKLLKMKEDDIIKKNVPEVLKQMKEEYSQNDNIKVIQKTKNTSTIQSLKYGSIHKFTFEFPPIVKMKITSELRNKIIEECYEVPLSDFESLKEIENELNFYNKYIEEFKNKISQ